MDGRWRVGRCAVATSVLVLAFGAASGSAQAAPGNPRVPGGATTIFLEDFENVATPATAVFLNTYTGVGPLNMTYTAHPAWINGPACDGIIGSFNSNAGTTGCSATVYNTFIRPVAQAIGNVFGGGDDNQVLADVTATGAVPAPVNAATFQTATPVPLPSANRFITFSVDVGVTTCSAPADPLLRFFLVDGATDIPTTATDINPCTDPRGTLVSPGGAGGIRVGSFPTDTAILFGGSAVGVKLANAQTGGSGNDYSIDNVRILDATPQLDKAFVADVQTNQAARLVLTVTNTNELASKAGWSFTDSLPAGLQVSATPNTSVTCQDSGGTPTPPTPANPVNVTAAGGGTSIAVAGNLKAGDAYCEVGIDVAAVGGLPGTFTNDSANVTSRVGLDAPGSASVTFGPVVGIPLLSPVVAGGGALVAAVVGGVALVRRRRTGDAAS